MWNVSFAVLGMVARRCALSINSLNWTYRPSAPSSPDSATRNQDDSVVGFHVTAYKGRDATFFSIGYFNGRP